MEAWILLVMFSVIAIALVFGIKKYLGVRSDSVTFKSKKYNQYFIGTNLITDGSDNSIDYWTFYTADDVEITDEKFCKLLYDSIRYLDVHAYDEKNDVVMVDDTQIDYTIESITKPLPKVDCVCDDDCEPSTCCQQKA
jgi:hypothetical protein